jgi:hypothetical protein
MNFNFGEVLSGAWQIAWKHKVLWWAGIIVTVMGLLSLPINLFTNPAFTSFSGSSSDISRNLAPILIGNGLILLISILSIPVTVLAMLVPSLAAVRLEQGSEQVRFGELLKAALPYFWRTLGIFLLVWVGAFTLMMVLMGCVALFVVLTLGFGMLCMIPLFLLYIPLAILVYAMVEQAMAAVVVDNLGFGAAIQRAWELVRKNFLAMAIMSVLIYLAYMVIGMIISVPMMIPFFGMFFHLSTQGAPDFAAFDKIFRNMMLWMLVFSPLYAVLQGFLLAFMQALWMLTYMRVAKPADNQPIVIEANA